MKITSARVIVCSPGRNFVTLKIETEDGIYGLGDATLNQLPPPGDELRQFPLLFRLLSQGPGSDMLSEPCDGHRIEALVEQHERHHGRYSRHQIKQARHRGRGPAAGQARHVPEQDRPAVRRLVVEHVPARAHQVRHRARHQAPAPDAPK